MNSGAQHFQINNWISISVSREACNCVIYGPVLMLLTVPILFALRDKKKSLLTWNRMTHIETYYDVFPNTNWNDFLLDLNSLRLKRELNWAMRLLQRRAWAVIIGYLDIFHSSEVIQQANLDDIESSKPPSVIWRRIEKKNNQFEFYHFYKFIISLNY